MEVLTNNKTIIKQMRPEVWLWIQRSESPSKRSKIKDIHIVQIGATRVSIWSQAWGWGSYLRECIASESVPIGPSPS